MGIRPARLAFGLLVLLTFATSTPGAAQDAPSSIPGWPPKVGANIWTRYENRENYDRLGVSRGRFTEGDFAVYRARLSLTTAPIDLGGGQRVSVQISPQVDGFWGDQPSTVSNPNLGVYEAYLRLENAYLVFDVGHFSMNYGDALVIGDLRWHQTARSFDGARMRISADRKRWWVDLFFTQLDEGLGGLDADIFAGDAYFTGLYANIGKLLSDGLTLEPYLLTQIWTSQDDAVDGSGTIGDRRPAVQATAGLRVLHAFGPVDARVEAGVQFGKRRVGFFANPDALAFQVDVEFGVTLAKGLRLSVEGLFASGDDPETGDEVEGYDELFPTTHKFLGLADVIGVRTNVGSGVVHIKYAGLKSWVFKLDQHFFVRPETADGQEGFAGAETDINVIYKIGRGMSLRVMYALFVPGSDHFFVEGEARDDAVHYVEVQYGLSF